MTSSGVFEEPFKPSGAAGSEVKGKPRTRWTIPRMVYRDGATIPKREFLYGYAYHAASLPRISATVALARALI